MSTPEETAAPAAAEAAAEASNPSNEAAEGSTSVTEEQNEPGVSSTEGAESSEAAPTESGEDQNIIEDEEVIDEDEYEEEEVIDEDEEEYEEEEVIDEEDDDEIIEEIVDDDEEAVEEAVTGEETIASSSAAADQTGSVQGSQVQETSAGESEEAASAVQSAATDESDPVEEASSSDPTATDASDQPDPEGVSGYAQFHAQEDSQTSVVETVPYDQPAGDDVGDIENQTETQNTPTPPPPAAATSTQVPSSSSNRGDLSIEKEGTGTSCIWYLLICLVVCGLLGGGAYAGYYLVTENRDDAPDLGEDDDITAAPSAAPTVGFTTPFDSIQGNCDFMNLRNPHVIDQCACVGEIQILADDVRARYESHRINFIPRLYETYNDRIDSCSPRNQALVWISSANDFEYEFEERVERFALAAAYAGLKGVSWRNSDNWFSQDSVCTWEGVVCRADDMVQALTLSGNNLGGTVCFDEW